MKKIILMIMSIFFISLVAHAAAVMDYSKPFTAVARVRLNSDAQDSRLLGCWTPTTQYGWLIWYDVDGGNKGWASASSSNGTGAFTLTGVNTASGTVGEWEQITFVWDGVNDRLFVGTQEITEQTGLYPTRFSPSTPTYIGYGGGSYGYQDIESACLFSRALTPARIVDLSADPLLPFRKRKTIIYSSSQYNLSNKLKSEKIFKGPFLSPVITDIK